MVTITHVTPPVLSPPVKIRWRGNQRDVDRLQTSDFAREVDRRRHGIETLEVRRLLRYVTRRSGDDGQRNLEPPGPDVTPEHRFSKR